MPTISITVENKNVESVLLETKPSGDYMLQDANFDFADSVGTFAVPNKPLSTESKNILSVSLETK